MGMGVIHSLLFQLTGNDIYRERALRTARSLRCGPLATADGVLINDRDAWTDGTFAGEWAREVLKLPGITPGDKELLHKTAHSIFINARTADGNYAAGWSGPAQRSGWEKSDKTPQEIMTTSASSANMIVAAGGL